MTVTRAGVYLLRGDIDLESRTGWLSFCEDGVLLLTADPATERALVDLVDLCTDERDLIQIYFLLPKQTHGFVLLARLLTSACDAMVVRDLGIDEFEWLVMSAAF